MIEAQIPKDIRKYEAKLAGPFTLRQLICFILSSVVAYFAYKGISLFVSPGNAIPICMFLVSPIIAVGWVKPYGTPLEKFIKTAFISNVLSPKVRKYKTKNNFSQASERLKKMSDSEYTKRLKLEKKMAMQNSKYERFK